jgi:hypothetical protein
METFVKWGQEKRQLNEVLGTLAAGAAVGLPVAGIAYLWTKGGDRTNKHKKQTWWVYKSNAPEGQKKKTFDGVSIVKMFRSGELTKDDLFIPPGATNWRKIGYDRVNERKLPWNQVGEGGEDKTGWFGDKGRTHVRVKDDTKWVAFIDGNRVNYANTKEFVKAIFKRDIEADTWVWHDGYGQNWKKFSHKTVQSEIAPFLKKVDADTLPTLGDEKLFGAEAKYLIAGKVHFTKFEDLPSLKLRDDTYVFVRKYKNEWVRYKELKKILPSIGQAATVTPRGKMSNMWRYMHGHRTVDRSEPVRKDRWDSGGTTT